MAEGTLIEWARHPKTGLGATWNIVTGCDIVSPGCTNCYAMKLAGTRLKHHPSRKGLTRDSNAGPVWNGEVRFNEQWLTQPLSWTRPHGIFVAAHGDLFSDGITDGQLMQILSIMAQCPQHVFYVLTKRPERMRDFFRRWADTTGENFGDFVDADGPDEVRAKHKSPRGQLFAAMLDSMGAPPPGAAYPSFDWMGGMINWPEILPNIWLGVSVEDQKRADERIPVLLDTPAAIRFISAEPLLGPIDLTRIPRQPSEFDRTMPGFSHVSEFLVDALDGTHGLVMPDGAEHWSILPPDLGFPSLHWVIAGGESGNRARPSHPEWFTGLRDQCAEADVAFFFKQWGSWAIASEENGHHDSAMASNDAIWLDIDGRQAKPSCCGMTNPIGMFMPGKKRAGRTLDGRTHDAFPETRP